MFAIRGITPPNPFVLAPLDGYSDLAFRIICRRLGSGLNFTEMIPAIALTFRGKDAYRRMRISPEEGPVVVQIVGSREAVMAEAARVVEAAGAGMVDVNAGCPSRRVTNGGAGAALLSDLPLLARILTAVRQAIRVPLTLKIRSGPSAGRYVIEEVAKIVADTGVDAVTIHPRTRTQGFKGTADWSLISRWRDRFSVPVIGNGDVASAADGLRMMRETGCDAVMVGRGAIGNPWLFRELAAAWNGEQPPPRPDREEFLRTVRNHFELMVDLLDGDEERAARAFRKHVVRYVRGLSGAVRVRRRLCGVVSRATLFATISEGFLPPPDDGPACPEPDFEE